MNVSEKSSARLRLAIIGAGLGWAGLGAAPHFQSLEDLVSEAEVVWVYGRSAEHLAAAQTPQGAQKTPHLEDILDDATVQAVLVLPPAHSHPNIVQRVACGRHRTTHTGRKAA